VSSGYDPLLDAEMTGKDLLWGIQMFANRLDVVVEGELISSSEGDESICDSVE
jgi:hypothetical protein